MLLHNLCYLNAVGNPTKHFCTLYPQFSHQQYRTEYFPLIFNQRLCPKQLLVAFQLPPTPWTNFSAWKHGPLTPPCRAWMLPGRQHGKTGLVTGQPPLSHGGVIRHQDPMSLWHKTQQPGHLGNKSREASWRKKVWARHPPATTAGCQPLAGNISHLCSFLPFLLAFPCPRPGAAGLGEVKRSGQRRLDLPSLPCNPAAGAHERKPTNGRWLQPRLAPPTSRAGRTGRRGLCGWKAGSGRALPLPGEMQRLRLPLESGQHRGEHASEQAARLASPRHPSPQLGSARFNLTRLRKAWSAPEQLSPAMAKTDRKGCSCLAFLKKNWLLLSTVAAVIMGE